MGGERGSRGGAEGTGSARNTGLVLPYGLLSSLAIYERYTSHTIASPFYMRTLDTRSYPQLSRRVYMRTLDTRLVPSAASPFVLAYP